MEVSFEFSVTYDTTAQGQSEARHVSFARLTVFPGV
jgi:hypothetical protein